METIWILAAFAWLLVESTQRKRREKVLESELAHLRKEVGDLRSAPRPLQPGLTPPVPREERPKTLDDTAPVVVPQWIRDLPAPPVPAPPTPAPAVAAPPVPASQPLPPAPRPPAPASQPLPPAPRPPVPGPLAEPPKAFDWESLVGVKLFSYVAGIALLVAAVAFLRFGIDHGWLGAPVRMGIGLVTGVGLLGVCETRRAQAYGVTAQSLAAAGIATLFSTFYASAALWHLLPAPVAFLFMGLMTAVAVVLSIRRDSAFIALLGLVGGFATPLLLSVGEDRPFGLFGYLALLNIGLGWVAYRKRWPLLTALTLAFTAFYQLGWVIRFLDATKLGIGLGIFLLFPLLAFGALFLARSEEDGDLLAPFRRQAALSALPPVLLALHMAVNPVYGHHYGLMFGFLFLVASGLAAVALFRGPEILHPLAGGGVLSIFAVWLAFSYTPEAWPGILGFVALFAALYLGLPWIQTRLRRKRPFHGPGLLAVYAAPLLMFVFPVMAMLERATAAPWVLFAGLGAVLAMTAAFAIRFGEGPVYFTAALFTLLAEAVWSARWLHGAHVWAALGIYGGCTLVFLGVPLMAARRGRSLSPEGSGAILAFLSMGLLFFLATPSMARLGLPVLAALLGLMTLGLLAEASRGRRPWLATAGMALGFLVLMVWWGQAPLDLLLLPALGVLLGFTLLVTGGIALVGAGTSPLGSPETLLGLTGFLFLIPVAGNPALATPPWPVLGTLALMALAMGAAALRLRRGAMLVGASLLVQGVLAAWVLGTGGVPVLALAPWVALGFAVLGYLEFELGALWGGDGGFSLAGGLGFVGAQGVLLVVKDRAGMGGLAPLVVVHAALAAGLLLLASRSRRHGWALVLAFTTGALLLNWASPLHVPEQAAALLMVAAPLYALQLVYPLLLGEEARESRNPWLASVLASGVFFLAARPALVLLGHGDVIGLLPLIQAFFLVPHLLRLRGGRSTEALGTLALVAGAILALITVAIPLQLDREWITVGWALLAAALAWLYTRIPHKGLLAWCAGLFAAVLVRLVLNPGVFAYHPRSDQILFNWYLYAYLVPALCFFAASRLLKGRDDGFASLPLPGLSRLLPAGGALILFLLVNIEIADAFSTGPVLTFNLAHGSLAQDLSYTIGWAVYAILLLVAGVAFRSRVARVASILLLTVTVLKAFLHDLSSLDGLYRVASFVGLAACLAGVALILQKFILHPQARD